MSPNSSSMQRSNESPALSPPRSPDRSPSNAADSGFVGVATNPLVLKTVRKPSDKLLETVLNNFTLWRARDLVQRRLMVEFESEPGIDSGGLTKDLLVEVSRALASTGESSCPYFQRVEPAGVLMIRPYATTGEVVQAAIDETKWLSHFFALGKLIGKTVHDRLQLSLPLASCIWCHILGQRSTEAELDEIDPSMAKSFLWMRDNTIEGVIMETFAVDPTGCGGADVPNDALVELSEGGKEREVTDENKGEYIELMTQWKCSFAIAAELEALSSGVCLRMCLCVVFVCCACVCARARACTRMTMDRIESSSDITSHHVISRHVVHTHVWAGMAMVIDPEDLSELHFEPHDMHRLLNGVDINKISVEEIRGYTKYKPPFTDAHRVSLC